MALPTDSGALFDYLQADTALAALLGLYTFKGGGTAPALSRLWPNEAREQGTVCSGVEVAIGRVPTAAGEAFFSGEVAEGRIFRIYVTQWTALPGGTANLDAVVTRILQLLQGAASSTPAGLPDGLTGLGQVVIRYESEQWLSAPLP